MWIRSQNKKTLMEVNKIYTTYDRGEGQHHIKSANIVLGKYPTVERSLQVLDGLEQYLISRGSNSVYELPKK